jgi:hypothetical protein
LGWCVGGRDCSMYGGVGSIAFVTPYDSREQKNEKKIRLNNTLDPRPSIWLLFSIPSFSIWFRSQFRGGNMSIYHWRDGWCKRATSVMSGRRRLITC